VKTVKNKLVMVNKFHHYWKSTEVYILQISPYFTSSDFTSADLVSLEQNSCEATQFAVAATNPNAVVRAA